MLTFKRYKKIYPSTTIKKYIFNYILYKPRKILRIPYCVYMCIKYPFLYPKNRFTGLHYNNWKIKSFLDSFKKKYKVYIFEKDSSKLIKFNKKNVFYINKKDFSITYWKKWWSKPIYEIIKFFHDYILQIIFCLPTSTEWDAVEPGWKKAFGKQYLNELKNQLKKENNLYSFRIMQIKEKFGTFRLYPAFASDEIYNIILKYEDISYKTCIKCGKPATHISTGWISPYCKECANSDPNYNYLTFEEYNNLKEY